MDKNKFFQSQVNIIDLIIIITCAVVAILTTVLYGSPSETVLGIFGGALGIARHSITKTGNLQQDTHNYNQPVQPDLHPSNIQTIANAINNDRKAIGKLDEKVTSVQKQMINDKADQILNILAEQKSKVNFKKPEIERPTKSLFDEE